MKKLADLNLDHLQIISSKNILKLSQDLVSDIEMSWIEKSANAVKSNRPIWNGTIYRLDSFEKKPDGLVLSFSEIDYKTYLFSEHVKSKLSKLPFKQQINGIYVAAQIMTSDGHLLIGKTQPNSLFNHRYDLVSGSLNKDEMKIDSAEKLISYIHTEIFEETGIDSSEIVETKGICLLRTSSSRIGIFFFVKLSVSSKDFSDRSILNFEHSEILSIPYDKILGFINTNKSKINPTVSFTLSEIFRLKYIKR